MLEDQIIQAWNIFCVFMIHIYVYIPHIVSIKRIHDKLLKHGAGIRKHIVKFSRLYYICNEKQNSPNKSNSYLVCRYKWQTWAI